MIPEEITEIFECGQCKRRFAWKPELAGQSVPCKCGAMIIVPDLTPTNESEIVLEEDVAPVPVIPLPYASLPPPYPGYGPDYGRIPGKPGILGTIGVASIIVGFISILASGFTATIWWAAYSKSTPPPPPPPAPPLAAVSFAPFTGTLTRPHGMPADKRAAFVAALPVTGHFDADRRALFDRLLAEDGMDIFPNLTVPDWSAERPTGSGMYQHFEFTVPTGAISISSNTARFGGPSGTIDVRGDMVTLFNRGGPRWSALAIDQRLRQLRKALPAITDMQAGFIANELLNAPCNKFNGEVPISQASLGAGNVLSVTLQNGPVWVLPDGRGISKAIEPQGVDPASGRPLTVHTRPFTPQMSGDPSLMFDLFAYCLVVIGLAILLIVSGIVMLIRPVIGVPAHCWFIALKFTLIATEIFLSMSFFNTVSGSRANAVQQFNVDVGTTGLITGAIFQSIYPVALLIVLASAGGMREYLRQEGGFVGLVSRKWLADYRRRWRKTSGGRLARIAFGCLGITAAALAVAHLQNAMHGGPASPSHVVAIVAFCCFGFPFLWIALRKPAGGAA